jgi:hypothetical protein
VFSICRLLFLIFNYHFFGVLTVTQIIAQFIVGLKYDLMAMVALHTLFILLHFVGWSWFQKKGYQLFLKALFILTHIPILILELIDTAYFPYNLKRTTVGALAVGA